MRVAVLPREVAASVITGTVSRMAWAYGALSIVLDVPVLLETYIRAEQTDQLPLPLALLTVQLAALGFAAWVARPWTVIGYLVIGALCCGAFQLEVMHALPHAVPDNVFLLNRPAIALVTVGVTASSTLVGIGWLVIGFGVSSVMTAVVAIIAGSDFSPGAGPALMVGIGTIAYLLFTLIQRRSRSKVPDFDELERETQDLVDGVNLTRRTTAVVHDTVLNDLAIVMNGPDRLDERARLRLRTDLETLTSAEWLSAAREVVPPDDQDVAVRNAISAIVTDMQWRGLTVQVSGVGDGITRLAPELVDALLDGIRSALENALRHSGAASAELALAYDDESVTVMVIDQGKGFDPARVDGDRLGIRGSIVRRVEDAGGRVHVWSTPGAGTSVVMSGPIQQVVLPHPPSRHREADQRGALDG